MYMMADSTHFFGEHEHVLLVDEEHWQPYLKPLQHEQSLYKKSVERVSKNHRRFPSPVHIKTTYLDSGNQNSAACFVM